MREPDVHLTDAEQATFVELERRLGLSMRRHRRIAVLAIAATLSGLAILIIGLLAGRPLVGFVGFTAAVAGLAGVTQRVTSATACEWLQRVRPSSPARHHRSEP